MKKFQKYNNFFLMHSFFFWMNVKLYSSKKKMCYIKCLGFLLYTILNYAMNLNCTSFVIMEHPLFQTMCIVPSPSKHGMLLSLQANVARSFYISVYSEWQHLLVLLHAASPAKYCELQPEASIWQETFQCEDELYQSHGHNSIPICSESIF